MKPIAALLLLLFSASAVIADEVPSVGRLADASTKAYSPIDENGFCSVFYIGGKRFITAGHCAAGNPSKMKVILQGDRQVTVEVLAYASPEQGMQDFTVLEAPDATLAANIKTSEMDCKYEPKIGDNLRVEGFPADMGFTTVWGKVSRKASPWAAGKGGWTQSVYGVNVAITGGDSGAPIFNEATGKVVGIVVGAWPKNQSLAVVQPLGPLCSLLGIH